MVDDYSLDKDFPQTRKLSDKEVIELGLTQDVEGEGEVVPCQFCKVLADKHNTVVRKDGSYWYKGQEPVYCRKPSAPGEVYCEDCLEEWF